MTLNKQTSYEEEIEILQNAREYWVSEGAINIVADIDDEIRDIRKLLGQAPTAATGRVHSFENKYQKLASKFNTK